MNKLKRISVYTFAILLKLVLDIRANCSWDSASEIECTISCKNTNFQPTETIMASLQKAWIEVVMNDFISH